MKFGSGVSDKDSQGHLLLFIDQRLNFFEITQFAKNFLAKSSSKALELLEKIILVQVFFRQGHSLLSLNSFGLDEKGVK